MPKRGRRCWSNISRLISIRGDYRHGSSFRFAEEGGGFFGGSGIDVEAGAPFEAGDPGELRHHFDVPMVMVVDFLTDGRGVDNEIVRGETESRIEARQEITQPLGEVAVVGRGHVFECRAVLAR